MMLTKSPVQHFLCNVAIAALIFVAVLAPRFVALDVFVTADEGRWLQRSYNVARALPLRQWNETFQREHPGYTTTLLGAIGVSQVLTAHVRADGPSAILNVSWLEDLSVDTLAVEPLLLLAAARRWVTIFFAILFAISFFPLCRLIGRRLAAFSILFVTWSPISLAFSRQLQPDGTLAALCFACLAFFFAWLYGSAGLWSVVLSGIFMGLAWLTKVPAVLLAPTGALLAAMEWRLWRRNATVTRANDQTGNGTASSASRQVGKQLAVLFLWLFIAVATFIVLWPAMWVSPISTLQKIVATMVDYSGGHTNPNFFMGRIVDDPGPFFYPVAYLFRITPATIIGLVAAAFTMRNRHTVFGRRTVSHTAFGFLIFALLYILMMTFVGKKFDRYILPAYLALDFVAALGLIALAQAALSKLKRRPSNDIAARDAQRYYSLRSGIVIALVIIVALGPLHSLLAIQHYPYYLTYFNPLVGGNRTAPRVLYVGWGEGLEEVASWLNQQPDQNTQYVISWYAYGPLSYFLDGVATTITNGSRLPWLDVDYVVTYINQVQRKIPTDSAIAFFEQQEPAYEVTLHGMTMAQVYDMHTIVDDIFEETSPPVAMDVPDALNWPSYQLANFATLPQTSVASVLPVEMTWDGEVNADSKASLRLSHEDGTLVAQQDIFLAEKVNTTLFVPPDAEPGLYHLRMMLYEDESLEPIPTMDGRSIIDMVQIPITPEE